MTTLQELLSNMKGKRPAQDTGECSVTAESRHFASFCYMVFLRHQTSFTITAVAHNSHALTSHFFMNKQHQTLSEGENPAIKCVLQVQQHCFIMNKLVSFLFYKGIRIRRVRSSGSPQSTILAFFVRLKRGLPS